MSAPVGCNQHRHQPGCPHPEAPHNRSVGSASPWGRYVPAGMDDDMTAASENAMHDIYLRLTQIEHTDATWPSDDDRAAAESMPWPEMRTALLAVAVREELMAQRQDGRTPPPHPRLFDPDEVVRVRREVMRRRFAAEQAARLPEVDIDLMADYGSPVSV